MNIITARTDRIKRPVLYGLVGCLLLIAGQASAGLNQQGALAIKGAPIYRENCQSCHGKHGKGNGPAAVDLLDTPTDFTTSAASLALTQAKMLAAVRKGHSFADQPLWRKLDETEELAAIDYIRAAFMSVNSKRSNVSGEALYLQNCATCHGVHGTGRTEATKYLQPPPNNLTALTSRGRTSKQINNTISFGIPNTAMKGYAARLSQAEIAAITDYIEINFANADTASVASAEKTPSLTAESAPLPIPLTSTSIASAATTRSSLPFPDGLVGNFRLGKTLYQTNCQPCHGREGEGNGPRAHISVNPPKSFGEPTLKSNWSRPHLYDAIAKGTEGTAMSAWASILSSQDIADVAEYLYATFAVQDDNTEVAANPVVPTEVAVAPIGSSGDGRTIFLNRCANCHGADGRGKSQAARYLNPSPRDLTTLGRLNRLDILDAVRRGVKNTAMAGFAGKLSEEDLAAVSDYIINNVIPGQAADEHFHNAENGWPQHRLTYAQAFPFAFGQISPMSNPRTLTPRLREGLEIFQQACIACHDPIK